MNPTSLKKAAWLLVAGFVLTMSVAIYMGLNPPPGIPRLRLLDALWGMSFVGFPITGALVVQRMPRRILGWLLCWAPLLLALALVLGDTGIAASDYPGTQSWFGWGANATFSTALAMLVFVPLLLPNGELPSRRWRIPVRAMLAISLLWMVVTMFAPGRLEEFPDFANPAGIEPLRPMFEILKPAIGPAFGVTLAIGAASTILRFRRSTGQERQQLKWIAFGGLVVLACIISIAVTESVVGDLSDVVTTLITMAAILAFPTSIAIAIMRYRLYDIDVIINRTLVYAALTAILAATYLGLVVAFQRLLAPLTRQSDIAVAASTLAVAALFGPVRRRVQAFIDRRFYRSRYNAQKTLEAFTARLRDEIDLEHLTAELLGVITTTVRPRHAGIWLRRPTPTRPS